MKVEADFEPVPRRPDLSFGAQPDTQMKKLVDLLWKFRARLRGDRYAHRWRQLLSTGTVVVGRHTYGIPRVDTYRGSESRVIVGNFCSISRDVVIITGGIHETRWISTFPFRVRWQMPGAYEDSQTITRGDILIGSDVWIGTGATILSGVSIGHGAVVAARAVVTKDVPHFSVVAGSPARIVRYRFGPGQIEALLRIAWWNWSDERILECVPLLSSPDIEHFISKFINEEPASSQAARSRSQS